MTVCHLRGGLVEGRGFLPLDPTDYQHKRVMPAVGCNNLHCPDCNVVVRQQAKLRVRSGAELQARAPILPEVHHVVAAALEHR